MKVKLEELPGMVNQIKKIRDTIITNIVLIGEKSAPTFKEKGRAKLFQERLAEFQIDECTTDSYQNPIGIIRGSGGDKKPPIFVVAHLDTHQANQDFCNYTVRKDTISGPGVEDNSTGVGVLVSLPVILKQLKLKFKSDIVLAGVIQSNGKGNLRGIRHLIKTWKGPIRGAVCVEGVELGRLNHYSEGMVRAEVDCISSTISGRGKRNNLNAILILNEMINKILELRMPQRPYSKIVIGKINGGYHHGRDAFDASLGLEIHSDADDIVKELINEIKDIAENLKRVYEVDLKLKVISNLSATRLKFNHPLVKSADSVMKKLGLEPKSESSESELSIFLSNSIPAVTLGITRLKTLNPEPCVEITPIFKGIAQLIGVLQAIDNGVCDGKKLA
jgi:tripeptide aminopeptidase